MACCDAERSFKDSKEKPYSVVDYNKPSQRTRPCGSRVMVGTPARLVAEEDLGITRFLHGTMDSSAILHISLLFCET